MSSKYNSKVRDLLETKQSFFSFVWDLDFSTIFPYLGEISNVISDLTNRSFLSTSVFRPDINVAATSWSWCRFPDKILNLFQYHYNFLFPKIYCTAWSFQFLINKIYSACVNAKRLLKWWIFENFQLVAWIEKRDFWSCVVHWSETAPCFLAVNSLGSSFNYFLRSGIQNMGVWYLNAAMVMWNHFEFILI